MDFGEYHKLSAVPPDQYQQRFSKFLERHVFRVPNNVAMQKEFIESMMEELEMDGHKDKSI